MNKTMSYDLKAKIPKPKWYQFRNILSNFFLWLAKKTYAENPEVWLFQTKMAVDQMIYGQSIARISPEEYFTDVDLKPGKVTYIGTPKR